MAGYIGSKTVNLSTTGADIAGDADVSGDLTVDTNTLHVDSTNNRVGVGTILPNQPLTVATNSSAQGINITGRSSDDRAYMFFSDNNGTTYRGSIHTIPVDNRFNINAYSGENITFSNSGAEKVRLDASGNLLVGTTSVLDSGGENAINVLGSTTLSRWCMITKSHSRGRVHYHTSSGGISDYFIVGSTNVGAISQNTTSTTYATSSDHRLKTDAQPMTGATDRLKQLNPVNFEWIADGTRVDGFLAHEAQAVVPEAVTGTKDAMRDEEYEVTPAVLDEDGNVVTEAVMGTRSVPDHQGIDQSKLVPLLTAALQEALTKIDDMETRLAALEAV